MPAKNKKNPRDQKLIADYVRLLYTLQRDGGFQKKFGYNKFSIQLQKLSAFFYKAGDHEAIAAETIAILITAMAKQIQNPPPADKFRFEGLLDKNEENDKRIKIYVISLMKQSAYKVTLTQAGRFNQMISQTIRKNLDSLIKAGKVLRLPDTSLSLAPGTPVPPQPVKKVFSASARLNHAVIRDTILIYLKKKKKKGGVTRSLLEEKVRELTGLTKFYEDSLDLITDGPDEGISRPQPVSVDAADGIAKIEIEPLAHEIYERVKKSLPPGVKGKTMIACYVRYHLDPRQLRPGLSELADEYHVKSPQTILNYCTKIEEIMRNEANMNDLSNAQKKWLVHSLCELMIREAENNG